MKRDVPVIDFDKMLPELERVIRYYAGDKAEIKIMEGLAQIGEYRELRIVIQDGIEFYIQFR